MDHIFLHPVKFITIRKRPTVSNLNNWALLVAEVATNNVLDLVDCDGFKDAINMANLILRRYELADLLVREAMKAEQ